MLVKNTENHWLDEDGNPAGGCSFGPGMCISWQNGPLGRGDDRKEPNGALVEPVIATVVARLKFYQNSKFACDENADAIQRLENALAILNGRTARRESAGTEGTHQGT